MKNIIYIIALISISQTLNSQSCKKKYKNQLEPNSKVISCAGNYTIEKLKSGVCILKRYYPETKMITQITTFKSDKLKVMHGLYQECWDDGTIVNKGEFYDNQMQGIWITDTYEKGYIEKDKKQGLWKSIDSESKVSSERTYLNGKLHGKEIHYDSLGNVTLEQEYKLGNLISTTIDTTEFNNEEFPRFPGCEELNLSSEELNQCAKEKLLKYVYGSLKYPYNSRKLEIEGKVVIQFVVDTVGDLKNITVLSGVSADIEKEALQLINGMPKWIPGKKDGKPVKVLFTLPIRFKLN